MSSESPAKPNPDDKRYLLSGSAWAAISTIAVELIRWGGIVWICYFVYCSIDSLAGRKTFADIKLLADGRVNEALAWVCGATGVTYGLRQKRLAKATIKRLQRRIRELESKLDPDRSSTNDLTGGESGPNEADV